MRSLVVVILWISFVVGSPFLELNDKLQDISPHHSLRRSTLPGKELGIFTEQNEMAYSPSIHISHRDWIDPYGMLHLSSSTIEHGSIQEQVWKELLAGRPGSGHPMLIILNQIPATSPSMLSVLLLRLLNSPETSSPLHAWLQLLPRDQHGTLLWSDDELSLLKGSPILERTKHLKETVIQSFELLDSQIFQKHRDLFPASQFDIRRFTYAYQLVLSRSFLIEGANPRRVLVPLADMFNHLPLPDAQSDNSQYTFANAVIHFNTENNIFSIFPVRDIQKGEEIFINYGDLPDSDLLLNYGFILGTNNIDNYYPLKAEFRSPFPLTIHLLDPVYNDVISQPPTIRLNNHNMVGTLKLLWWLRLCNLNFKELGQVMKVYYENDVVDIENELLSLRAAISLLTEKLDSYGTTIEYDSNFLQTHGMDLQYRTKTAILFRLNEKRILRVAVGHLRAMWQFILQTGEISSPQDLLHIPIDETKKPEYSYIVPPHVDLEIPPEADISVDIWSSLYSFAHQTHKQEHTDEESSESVIERMTYKPIRTASPNELQKFPKNNNGTINGRIKVAVLVASKVNKLVENAYELPLIQILLQSIIKTWSTWDKKMYFLTLYIGFDTGDLFYDSEANMIALHQAFDQLESLYPIQFRTVCTGDTHNAPAYAWSRLGNLAYHEGNEYFFQVNDDVEIQCDGWISKFVDSLGKTANLGVVGPEDPLRNLLTQAFVHRTHFEIFDPMYPTVFRNWYMDDWMELVYGKLAQPVRGCAAINSPHPPRYEIDTEAYNYLQRELFFGCVSIQLYSKSKEYKNWDKFFCTDINPKITDSRTSVALHPQQYLLSDNIKVPNHSSRLAQVLGNIANGDNLVMMTFTNFGFIEMTQNWIQNVILMDIHNYLVICLDELSFKALSQLPIGVPLFYDPVFSTESSAANYLEGHYRELVNLKTAYNWRILSLGFHTLLCDNDIALLKNPFDYIQLDDYDIQIQDDSAQIGKFSAVNTGFQLVRSNRKTVEFYQRVYSLTQEDPNLQDQRAYNTILQQSEFRHLLKWNILDPLIFPNGWIYFVEQLPQKQGIAPVIIHNNWIRGLPSKIHRFREQHLWLMDKPQYYNDPNARFFTYTNVNPTSYVQQSQELSEAIKLCLLLDRILILPPFKVFAKDRDIDFVTADMLYDMALFQDLVEIREHAFITHPFHKTESFTPLVGAHLIDITDHESKPCYQQQSACFQQGHRGYIRFDKAVSITSSQRLSIQSIHDTLGMQSSKKDVPLLVIPSVLGKFNFENHFTSSFLDALDQATTPKPAPHLNHQ